MYILFLILSVISVFVLAKVDNNASKKMNWKMVHGKYDLWVETNEGRKKIYLIFLLISLIPCLNILMVGASFLITLGILFYMVAQSDISKKLF